MTHHPHAAAATNPAESVVDPVCGAEVSPRTSLKVTFQDHTFQFCSPKCRERFEREPEKFVGFA
ncbi:MAG: YHS domain-containing protein [Myxococcota bacterium]